MHYFIICLFLTMVSASMGADRTISQTVDTTTARVNPSAIGFFRGESVAYTVTPLYRTTAISVSPGATATWTICTQTNVQAVVMDLSGSVASNGVCTFSAAVSNTTMAAGAYDSFVKIQDGATLVTASRTTLNVYKSPYPESPAVVPYAWSEPLWMAAAFQTNTWNLATNSLPDNLAWQSNAFDSVARATNTAQDLLIGSLLSTNGGTMGGYVTNFKATTLQLDTNFVDGVVVGRMEWNQAEGGAEIGMLGGTVNLQIGQENLIRVRNMSGSVISNGQVVAIAPAPGVGRVGAILCDSDAGGYSNVVDGVATERIAVNADGYVTTAGVVHDMNTAGFTEGDAVYASTNAGGLTATRPPYPIDARGVGTVAVSHGSQGELLVKPTWAEKTWSELDGQYLRLVNTNQFATSAQGLLANQALSTNGGTMGGDITMGTKTVVGNRFGSFAGYEASDAGGFMAVGNQAGLQATGSNWTATGYTAGYSADGDNWHAFGYDAGAFAQGNDWHSFGGEAGKYASHTNSHAFGRYSANSARGNDRLYIDQYAAIPNYQPDGATNDTIFLDNDGKLYLGGGSARAENPSAGGTLRGTWNIPSSTGITASQVGAISNNQTSVYLNLTGPANGFESQYAQNVSFDPLSRTCTITPTGSVFRYTVGNTSYSSGTVTSPAAPFADGGMFFYFRASDGTFWATNTAWGITSGDAQVLYVLYNTLTTNYTYTVLETHGVNISDSLHDYLHKTRGAVWASGITIANNAVDTLASAAANGSNTCIAVTDSGVFYDEDIVHPTTARGTSANATNTAGYFPIMYKTNGVWNRVAPSYFPFMFSGDTPQYVTASGVPTAVGEDQTFVYWMIAAGGIDGTNLYLVPHPFTYGSTALADTGATLANLSDTLGGFPSAEILVCYRLIFNHNAVVPTANPVSVKYTKLRKVDDYRRIASAQILAGTGPSAGISADSLIAVGGTTNASINGINGTVSGGIANLGTGFITNSHASAVGISNSLTVLSNLTVGGSITLGGVAQSSWPVTSLKVQVTQTVSSISFDVPSTCETVDIKGRNVACATNTSGVNWLLVLGANGNTVADCTRWGGYKNSFYGNIATLTEGFNAGSYNFVCPVVTTNASLIPYYGEFEASMYLGGNRIRTISKGRGHNGTAEATYANNSINTNILSGVFTNVLIYVSNGAGGTANIASGSVFNIYYKY